MGLFGFGKKINYEDFEDDEDELEYEEDDASLSLGGSNIELKVVKPTQFNQILTAGDHLIDGKTVLLNLEGLDKALSRRMIDFIAGVAYALNATIKSATNNSYFIAPRDVDVSGEIFDSSDDDTFCDL
jgi:cell division inhibitor SepF